MRSPFEVYVNGVRQELGATTGSPAASCCSSASWSARSSAAGPWFLGFWGIGTYKRNDEIDVRYEIDGRPTVAHALEIIPPS